MTPDPTTLLAEARGLLERALPSVEYDMERSPDSELRTLIANIKAHLAGAAVPPDEGRLSASDRDALKHACYVLGQAWSGSFLLESREEHERAMRVLERLLTQKAGDDGQG